MDVKLNIPDWLKIPINVLLPALWLFSGILLWLPSGILEKIHLKNWCDENGFSIGLAFIITTCLLLVYFLFYLKELLVTVYYKATNKRKTMKKISEMSDIEQGIIFTLYNSPGYTSVLDYNQPIIQGLLSRNYIYAGSMQQVTMSYFDNAMPIRFTLQPFVYQTLDYYRPKIKKEIEKKEAKLAKVKDNDKKKRMNEELENIKANFSYIYDGGNY